MGESRMPEKMADDTIKKMIMFKTFNVEKTG